MEKGKLSPIVTLNTLESMIEYMLISNILERICKMTKQPLEYPRDNTKLDPFMHLLKIRTWGTKWKSNWQNSGMGGMEMGKCEDGQRKFLHSDTKFEHLQGWYGGLQFVNVYTCNGLL